MPLLVPKNGFIFVYTYWQDVFALLAFKKPVSVNASAILTLHIV